MVTIVKGNEKIVCSYKTYEDQFKSLGYVLDDKTVKKTKESKKVEEKVETKAEIQPSLEEKISEEEKIGSKYGVRRRTSTKKEEK